MILDITTERKRQQLFHLHFIVFFKALYSRSECHAVSEILEIHFECVCYVLENRKPLLIYFCMWGKMVFDLRFLVGTFGTLCYKKFLC